MHRITVIPAHNVVESTLWGFLSVDDVSGYDADLQRHFRSGRLQAGYRMLIDVAGCAIQQQEVINAFQAHVLGCPKASRIAAVTGSSIVRMQVRRVLNQSYMRTFTDRLAAWEWLDIDNTAEASPSPFPAAS